MTTVLEEDSDLFSSDEETPSHSIKNKGLLSSSSEDNEDADRITAIEESIRKSKLIVNSTKERISLEMQRRSLLAQ
jgi:hypothetical protein